MYRMRITPAALHKNTIPLGSMSETESEKLRMMTEELPQRASR